MASKSGTSAKSRGGEDNPSASSNRDRDRESKPDRHPSRKTLVNEQAVAGSPRDSPSTLVKKDYNRGEMHSGSAEGGERKPEDAKDDRSKRRGDKVSTSQSPQESNERPSSVRTRSSSPAKRKPVPQVPSSQIQEPPRTLIMNLEDDTMSSPASSFEDIGSDVEEMRREGAIGAPPSLPAQQPSAELEAELQLAVAKAEEQRKQEEAEKLQRDFAMAKQLDQELNAKEAARVPGDFPDPADAAAPSRQPTRSSGGGFFSSSSDRQMDKLREKYADMKRRYEDAQKLAFQWETKAREQNSQANRYYQEAKVMEMEFNSAQKAIHHLDSELKASRHELSAVKQQLSDAVNLSDIRGRELKGAQVFLTKADTLSVSDVAQKVTALNEEIFQMAAFLGEVLIYEDLEEGSDRESIRKQAVAKGYKQAERMLGETLTNALAQESFREPKETSNQLLVQIVMQIALTRWCGNLGSRWTSYQRSEREQREKDADQGEQKEARGHSSVGPQAEYNTLLRELYDNIRDHEEQAVAGRWRSLTRAHLPFSANGWDHTLMLSIVSIMSVAGWATRSHDEMDQIEKRLGSIFKPLFELRKATGEDVTSVDLEIAVVEPLTMFDPRLMEDEYADGRSASKSSNGAPESVVSTSGLGLKKITVKKLKEGGVQRQVEMLALPKVVLEKTIKEALEPPKPRVRQQSTKKTKAAGDSGGPGLLSSMMGF